MTQRINYQKHSQPLFRKLFEMSQQVKESGLGEKLIDLVDIRASQLNGCAFCLDMHVKEAKIHGERELRVYHVSIWRESPLFSDKERAALEWTEVLSRIPEGGVPDDVFQRVSAQFSEKELSDLTFAVASINMWNRLNVSFQTPPGSADAMLGLDKAGLS